jgi:3-hydroxybutyryl-CoA dehydrogenase
MVKEVALDMEVSEISRVTIVGAGTMGRGIAQTFAQAGYSVFLHDLTEQILEEATAQVHKDLEELADCGVIDAGQIQPVLNGIRTTTSLNEAVSRADLVVEAVFEDLDLKRELFRELDMICPGHTILGSNTSFLMPSKLASATKRPDQVLVMHYFYPAHLLPLVEIVPSPSTSSEIVDTVYGVLRATGKSPIIVRKEAPGFVANRLQVALLREAMHIAEEGIATPQDIDRVVKYSFGRRLAVVGPFELVEMQSGWDAILNAFPYILPYLSRTTEVSKVILRQVEKGELGATSGKGFYEWTPGSIAAWSQKLLGALIGFTRPRTPG